eukprot:389490-Pyramimonas_sp.AAC.1
MDGGPFSKCSSSLSGAHNRRRCLDACLPTGFFPKRREILILASEEGIWRKGFFNIVDESSVYTGPPPPHHYPLSL